MHHSGQKKIFNSTMQSVLSPTLMPTTSSHKHTLFFCLQQLIRQLIRSGLILEITVGEEHKGLCSCYYVVFYIITNFLLHFRISTLLFLQIIRSRNSPVATSRIIIFLEIFFWNLFFSIRENCVHHSSGRLFYDSFVSKRNYEQCFPHFFHFKLYFISLDKHIFSSCFYGCLFF